MIDLTTTEAGMKIGQNQGIAKRGSSGKIRVSYPPNIDDLYSREPEKTSESGKKMTGMMRWCRKNEERLRGMVVSRILTEE